MPALTKAQKKLAQAAEDSFNRTYAARFGEERWQQSLYPALTAPTRYAALANRFTVADLDTVFSQEQLAKLQTIAFPVVSDLPGSKPLLSYQWDVSEAETTFPQPQPNASSDLLTHWNLDAASLLAVSILGPKPGDKVLDLCAAPGGKSVALSQFLRGDDYNSASPSLGGGCLHSNEVNTGRNKRLASNLQEYLPEVFFKTGEVKVLKLDGAEPSSVQTLPLGPGGYDKVLLDAPCSSERHVIHAHAKAKQGGRAADEMTSWRSGQSKKMAKTQVALLMTALKAVRVGGRVLYATCSLSCDENDAVVEKAMELVQKERKKFGTKWDFTVRSSELGASGLEGWAELTKSGWLVLPDHPCGGKWGPLFFALLERIET
ncbi:S-adenosyl-L-methionine-dependent methyltransferase [Xylaria bambusicola]|uniref:S-adenosyl-L-methionine-dependent methyltransferase n=1 Tax=Xylaria bambusicola TaxID=326684 RepID=UPI002008DE49|nr:S-adenosyl-L-methionine-dependent methyltransferase [Xylaria bambusicola]KAI0509683.1 S-adenosyl-L-methionine-dependent methyltransferase [Xylaria bambusicola]